MRLAGRTLLVKQLAVTAMDGLQLPLVQIVSVRQPTKTIEVELSGLLRLTILVRLHFRTIEAVLRDHQKQTVLVKRHTKMIGEEQ
jgi:hypothetical protein